MATKYLTGEMRDKFVEEFKKKHHMGQPVWKRKKSIIKEEILPIGIVLKNNSLVKQGTVEIIEETSYYSTSEDEES